ncbi:MAG: glycoside hydrolase family 15 protein [Phycisphaerales bacterium]|jgi:GH15 family glucan-1,4-alpha-glucosidase
MPVSKNSAKTKKAKLKKLIRTSQDVIEDSSLDNGAIVAANSDKSTYPPTVQDYRYVWVRDAAYVCIAADLLGLKDIPERFFDWCLNRAEGFKTTGLFQNAYHVNGTISGTLINPADATLPRKVKDKYLHTTHHGTQFQPDQNGSLLIAIDHHIKHFKINKLSEFKPLIEKTATGLSNSWKDGRFILPHFDLWEERCILPTQRRYHTYSLAICTAGLRAAMNLLGKRRNWLQTEKEMSDVFNELYSCNKNIIPATYSKGKIAKLPQIRKDDYRPDTSLLGLIYPAGILDPSDIKMKNTVDKIIKTNTIYNGGLLRYPRDIYCGQVKNGFVTLTGAGAWPLLNFWMAIYFHLRNDKKKSEKYFNWPLTRIDTYLPEQIFKDKKKVSISPLTWSHAMFIIAANSLNHI